MRSLYTLAGHTDSIFALAFSPNGARLSTASRDGTAALWRLDNCALEWRIQVGGLVVDTAFSFDGALVAFASTAGDVLVGDVATGQVVRTLSTERLECLAFKPETYELLIGRADGAVEGWDAVTGSSLYQFSIAPPPAVSLSFSTDGRLLAAASRAGAVTLLASDSWTINRSWQLPAGRASMYRAVISPDATTCAVSVHVRTGQPINEGPPNRYEIAIWDLRQNDAPRLGEALVGHLDWIGGLDFAPSENLLASGSFDNSVALWDPYTKQLIGTSREHEGAVYDVAFSPDGILLASCAADGVVKLWSVADADFRHARVAEVSVRDARAPLAATVAGVGRSPRSRIAEEIADRLLAQRSPKDIEDATRTLLSSGDMLTEYDLTQEVLYVINIRLERAYRAQERELWPSTTRSDSAFPRPSATKWKKTW